MCTTTIPLNNAKLDGGKLHSSLDYELQAITGFSDRKNQFSSEIKHLTGYPSNPRLSVINACANEKHLKNSVGFLSVQCNTLCEGHMSFPSLRAS